MCLALKHVGNHLKLVGSQLKKFLFMIQIKLCLDLFTLMANILFIFIFFFIFIVNILDSFSKHMSLELLT